MNIKEYEINGVKFAFVPGFRKWTFKAPNVELIQACNGRDTATKVARIVAGSLKRTKGIQLDGMARSQISRLGI